VERVYEATGPAAGGKELRQVAGEITAYFTAREYRREDNPGSATVT